MAASPPSVRMLGDVTAAAARPPSIPSNLVDISAAAQRPGEQDAIEGTDSNNIKNDRNMSIKMVIFPFPVIWPDCNVDGEITGDDDLATHAANYPATIEDCR